MPATSASGIIDLIRTRVDHSALSDTTVLDFINDAKRTMQRRFPLSWQESFTTAQTVTVPSAGSYSTFTLPTDYKVIRSVQHIASNVRTVIRHDPDFFGLANNASLPTSAAIPSFWTTWGDAGYLFPANSASISVIVYYERMLPDYASITATDNFITYAHEVLQYEGTAEYYDSIAEDKKAQVWHAKAERAMQLLLAQHTTDEERQDNPISTAFPTSVAGVVDQIRVKTKDTAFSDLALIGLINNAKRTMQRRYPLRWQETIATAVTLSVLADSAVLRTFTIPADYKAVRSVHLAESGTLQTIPFDPDFSGLLSDWAGATAAAYPSYWSQFGDTGYLFPKNSVSWEINVLYERMLDNYTSLTATDSFLTNAPEVLEYEAIAEYYDTVTQDKNAQGQPELPPKAQIWHAKAERAMQLLLMQERSAEQRQLDPTPNTRGRVRRHRSNDYYNSWW